jgi:hypothetical protein
LETYTDYGNYICQKPVIGNLLEMIKYKITGLKLSQLPTGILQKLQCNIRETGEGT